MSKAERAAKDAELEEKRRSMVVFYSTMHMFATYDELFKFREEFANFRNECMNHEHTKAGIIMSYGGVAPYYAEQLNIDKLIRKRSCELMPQAKLYYEDTAALRKSETIERIVAWIVGAHNINLNKDLRKEFSKWIWRHCIVEPDQITIVADTNNVFVGLDDRPITDPVEANKRRIHVYDISDYWELSKSLKWEVFVDVVRAGQTYEEKTNREDFIHSLNLCSDWCKMDDQGESYGGYWRADKESECYANAFRWSCQDAELLLWTLAQEKRYPQYWIVVSIRFGCNTRRESVRFTVWFCESMKRKLEQIGGYLDETTLRIYHREEE